MYLTLLNLLCSSIQCISHIRPNHLSGYALVPMWPDNRGRTVKDGGCLLQVNRPGTYHCKLRAMLQEEGGELQEVTRDSHSLQIVQVSEPDISHQCSYLDSFCFQSDSRTGLVCDAATHTSTEHANQNMHGEEIRSTDVTYDHTKLINHGSFEERFITWACSRGPMLQSRKSK